MNRVKAFGVLITFFFVCCSFLGLAQSTSSQGREFWTAYMSHSEDNGPSKMALYVTADEATTVTVEIANGSFPAIIRPVLPNQVTEINVPRDEAFIQNQGKSLQGIHITSGKKIAIFAHIFANAVSGATLLLPVAVLGKSYYSLNYTQRSNAQVNTFSTFMVIGTGDNTTVEITPSAKLVDGQVAGMPFTITLNKGEVYQGLSFTDLTNTKIASISSGTQKCKKIAVFSGSTKIFIGCDDNNKTSDNLFQQVYPTASWGKNYITVPLKSRNYDIFRVVLSDPNTTVTVNGNPIPPGSLQSNNVYEFSSNITNIIKADKPVQVIQYAVTQGKTLAPGCQFDPRDVGDPEMIYLNPVEQTINHVTLYSTGHYNILKHFINVVMRSDKTPTFKLDGQPYTAFIEILNGAGYAYAQIPVGEGTHTLAAEDGFNAIAYGFGDKESYGYSAGTNLKNLNEYIELDNPQTNAGQVNGCTGVVYKLQMVLPYISTSITWNFNDGSPAKITTNPAFTTFVKDGTTLYRYQYRGVLPPFIKGNYNYTATVVNPAALDDCGTSKDIDFDFNIADFAKTDFKPSDNRCSATDITVHDESVVDPASVTQIKLWWDYINHPEIFELYTPANIPADKNYHHTYDYSVTSTNYIIKMIVYTGEGSVCENGKERAITILGSPSVEITQVAPMCRDAGKVQITKNDKGFPGKGTFSGPGVTDADKGVFDPAVSGAGTFTIAYHFVATNGCDVTVTQDIVVNPLPTVDAGDFIPLLEGESVVIKPVVTGEGLSYQWAPSAGLDNANVLNPVCSAIDNTTYTLTVTTAKGCVAYDDVFIKVLKKPVIVSAFSPNGDGINDTWGIKYLDTYPGNTVDVYNRQGEKVYSSVGYASPWDGRFRGSALPTGTYYYIINPKNGRNVVSGSVTIIK
ncbi:MULTISPECIES: gliding motility-associated C-terminal domain-containing protein [unclassified Mucilaginibacter]|uniref:gliding motility-associated C-terminal domain-containing protein n=1 Tax=unclassified Mucilaginibacter TaxID=2617802 RepID=UPI002AC9427B|nr:MULTISPECIES: gliding motility-associated C-terminal domain-containing protein [unclassified Mucilaginibacter]MEB0260241.1 gliding motility-associated C-terminal domain-containing protein [Mucilaginibacter sp. 10I4]MEB0277348.1 gliding motility-associated C-terminal domain-containing protein [Mucilaginibacter sp. 10B2]MEB0300170.1 gliding motility-associated C-terminal domain-containing protein [Mucilaginibacter sp. 5C4]WPX25473.1 gliding motility-associated C-terminal domain-containing prot